MLHILLMILKIIGIIAAVILGFIILAVLVVIFAPLKYTLDAKCQGTLETLNVKIRFSWLFHLISGYCYYEEKETDWQMRIAWKKINIKEDEETLPKSQKNKQENDEIRSEKVSEEEEIKPEKQVCDDEEPKEEITVGEKEGNEPKRHNRSKVKRKKRSFIDNIIFKIKSFFEKIKYTITKIYDNIKLIGEKKDKIIEFLEHEAHRGALSKIKQETLRLIRFLKPKELKGRVHFGFDDPYVTGKVLAGLSILYPFYGNHIIIEPDFSERVLEGDIHVKGKLRGIHEVIIFFHILFNKDIRTTYKHIKNFKL